MNALAKFLTPVESVVKEGEEFDGFVWLVWSWQDICDRVITLERLSLWRQEIAGDYTVKDDSYDASKHWGKKPCHTVLVV